MGNIQEQSGKDFDAVVEEKGLGRGQGGGSSLRNAINGFRYVWQAEQNFRIEVLCGICAITLGIFLHLNLVPILLCCCLVLSLELINTAIERLVDLASPKYHPLAKQAKDIAAASVLLAATISVIIMILLIAKTHFNV